MRCLSSNPCACTHLSRASTPALLNKVYARFLRTIPMHAEAFPSERQMELGVLTMTAAMVGGVHVLPPRFACCPMNVISRFCAIITGPQRRAEACFESSIGGPAQQTSPRLCPEYMLNCRWP